MRRISAGRGNPNVVGWFKAVDHSALYLSVITVLELELGCQLIERRDAAQGAVLRRWLRGLLEGYRDRIIAIDSDIATRAASLHVPNPRESHDALIAASALIQRLVVVTRNVNDFEVDGLRVINPWAESV
jgi:toxin FitB